MGGGGTTAAADFGDAATIVNEAGTGRFVIVCDHASNRIPDGYATLGVDPSNLVRHIAWDPGALGVALHLVRALDAPLVHATLSRLIIDVNRAPSAPDSIVLSSEDTPVPGNRDLAPAERARRVSEIYEPYHSAIDRVLDRRSREGRTSALIAIHTFTPVYRGQARPWHVGILHDDDTRLARPLATALASDTGLVVGDNEPYAPSDGVYHTLTRHAAARGLASAMVEIRNDLVADAGGQREWAGRLAGPLAALDVPARAA